MRTEAITIYQFDELSDEAKERAREHERETFDFSFHAEYVTDYWRDALALIGFDDSTIYWSGFWSQGDGACFTCKRVDTDKLAAYCLGTLDVSEFGDTLEKLRPAFDAHELDWLTYLDAFSDFSFSVCSVGRYTHENSASLDCDGYSRSELVDDAIERFREVCEELRRDICRAIYSALEQEFEYQTADEQIDEVIRANEFEFTEDGEFYR